MLKVLCFRFSTADRLQGDDKLGRVAMPPQATVPSGPPAVCCHQAFLQKKWGVPSRTQRFLNPWQVAKDHPSPRLSNKPRTTRFWNKCWSFCKNNKTNTHLRSYKQIPRCYLTMRTGRYKQETDTSHSFLGLYDLVLKCMLKLKTVPFFSLLKTFPSEMNIPFMPSCSTELRYIHLKNS